MQSLLPPVEGLGSIEKPFPPNIQPGSHVSWAFLLKPFLPSPRPARTDKMKQQRLTVALALLVSPISSWNLDKPTPHQDSNVWNPTGFVADGGKAKSGGRCGIDAQGSACDDGLCCSDWVSYFEAQPHSSH